jgi:hypothetical protein
MQTTSTHGHAQAQRRLQRWVRRIALIIGVPLAVLGGVRAVSWAALTLKSWTTGETLTAADINGNFAMLAAAQAPDQIVAGFNAGVTAGAAVKLGAITPASTAYDLRWMVQHGAAAGACAAASPIGDSSNGHVVLPKPSGVTCAAACAANTGGVYTLCRTSIAIGTIKPTQAAAYTEVLAQDYNYGCGDSQSSYDEVGGLGLTSSYTAYCCCYH